MNHTLSHKSMPNPPLKGSQFRRSGNSFTVARQIRMSGAKSRARPTWLNEAYSI
jgi:hypothetical protein